jgi:hypothetical protein
MKLEEFITETINQIISGISKTHDHAKEKGATVNPRLEHRKTTLSTGKTTVRAVSPIHNVEFDVAVTTTEGKGTKGGFGVFVGPIGAGSQGQSESSNTSMSRIKFSIPIIFPTQDM